MRDETTEANLHHNTIGPVKHCSSPSPKNPYGSAQRMVSSRSLLHNLPPCPDLGRRSLVRSDDWLRRRDMRALQNPIPHKCWICGSEISLEQCKIDEHENRAVHAECHMANIRLQAEEHYATTESGISVANSRLTPLIFKMLLWAGWWVAFLQPMDAGIHRERGNPVRPVRSLAGATDLPHIQQFWCRIRRRHK